MRGCTTAGCGTYSPWSPGAAITAKAATESLTAMASVITQDPKLLVTGLDVTVGNITSKVRARGLGVRVWGVSPVVARRIRPLDGGDSACAQTGARCGASLRPAPLDPATDTLLTRIWWWMESRERMDVMRCGCVAGTRA